MMKVLSPGAEGYMFVLINNINKQLRIFDMNILFVPGFVKFNSMSLEKIKNCIQTDSYTADSVAQLSF